jgi:predicted metal-dependent phosphoesterase TrpH
LIRGDLHFHTVYSMDASNQPKRIVERLNAHPAINSIAITDHNTTEGYCKVHELAKAYADILKIPGIEVSAQEGEIIVLGASEMLPKPWTAANLIDHARANACLVIAPHPYRGLGLADSADRLDLDAIEILNGITSTDQNRRAEELAKARRLPGVAGSDAHDEKDPWNVYTEIQSPLGVDEALRAIKKGLVRVSYAGKSIDI